MMKLSLGGSKKSGAICLGLAALAMIGARQAGQDNIPEATKEYDLADGSKITLEGVCSYDMSRLSCWDSSGAPSPTLTSQIQGYYSREGQHDMSFKIGRKNRLVVFSRSGQNSELQLNQPQGDYIETTQMNNAGDGPRLTWAQIGAGPDASTTSVVVMAQGLMDEKPSQGVFKEGTTFNFHDIQYQIGGAKPAPREETDRRANWARNEQGLKFWNYFFVIKVAQRAAGRRIFHLLDKQGEQIKYVDRDGKPVSEMTYIKENPSPSVHAYREDDAKLKYFRVLFSLTSQERTARAFFSNVNPSEVGFVQVSGNKQTSVLFKDIPLDHK